MSNKEITQEDKQIIDALILEVLDDEYPRSTDDVVKYVQAYKDNATSGSIGVQLSRLCKRGLLCNLSKQGRKGYYVRVRRPGYLKENLFVLRDELNDLSNYLDDALDRESRDTLLLNNTFRSIVHNLNDKLKPVLEILNTIGKVTTFEDLLLQAEQKEAEHEKTYMLNQIADAADGYMILNSNLAHKPIKVSQEEIDFVSSLDVVANIDRTLKELSARTKKKRSKPIIPDLDDEHPTDPDFQGSVDHLDVEHPLDPNFDILAGEVVDYDPFADDSYDPHDPLLNPDFGANVDPLDEDGDFDDSDILDDDSYDPNDPLLDPEDNT